MLTTYADVCGRMLTYGGWNGRPHPEGAAPGQDLPPGTNFTGFTSTKGQILTLTRLPGMPEGYAEGAEEAVEVLHMLTYADVC
jgi:hypothetical protein